MKTYIRRAIKYFFSLVVLFAAIIVVLALLGYIPADVNLAFRGGWTSVLYIGVFFVVMAAAYPAFGYGKRTVRAAGDPEQYANAIDRAMDERGYQKVSPSQYRLRSKVNRVSRVWEDTITITPVMGGFQAEGLVRDLARVVMSLERKISLTA